MKASQFTIALIAGVVAGTAWVSLADAVTFRAGGSSAGTLFATQVPLNLCTSVPGNLPSHYVNDGSQINATGGTVTNGKLHVWRCSVPGFAGTTVFKYSATGSSDGVIKLNNASENFNCSTAGNPTLNNNCMTMLPDLPSSSNCTPTGSNPQTRPSDGKQFNEFSCSDTGVFETLNVGTADVAGSSFGQQGPITTTVNPLDQSALISTQVAIVPFDIVVGNDVGRVDAGGFLQPLDNLTRTEVEGLLSGNVSDWRQLGLATGTVGTSTLDTTSPVVLCMRKAGSGTKAALDQTVLKDAKESPLCSTNLTGSGTKFCGQSTQDVRDCIDGNSGQGISAHPTGIGYMDADASELLTGGHRVKLNGAWSHDAAGATEAERKKDLRCGRYLYWVGERFNTRNPSSADPTLASLIGQYITNAASPATISLLPAGDFWDAPESLFVSKANDPGPVLWKAGPHTACN